MGEIASIIGSKEAEQIWKSAQKSNPTATLTDDALENCIKAWQRQNKQPKKNTTSTSTKTSEKSNNIGNNEPLVKNKPSNIKWDKSCNSWKIVGAGSPAANARFLREELKVHERLKLNLLTMEYEIDGKSVSELYPNGVGYDLPTFMDEHFHFYFTGALDKFYPLIEQVATKFHPVQDYLRGLPLQDSSFIDEFIEKSLQITKPIHVLMVRKWLIGAARRILSKKPVKFDNALILQGAQGIGKSTFFEALAGADFFTDDMGNISDKDEKIKPHYSWMVEWSDLEPGATFSKKNYRGFYLTDDDGQIPPKLLQAFEDFGIELHAESVTSQSPDLVTNHETPATTGFSQSVTKTTPSTADDTFKVGDRVIDLEFGEELEVTKVENQADGQQCWVKSEKHIEHKVPSFALKSINQSESPDNLPDLVEVEGVSYQRVNQDRLPGEYQRYPLVHLIKRQGGRLVAVAHKLKKAWSESGAKVFAQLFGVNGDIPAQFLYIPLLNGV